MKIWIKFFIISLSALTALTLAWTLVRWDDPRSFYSVIWDYQTVRLYFLISVSTFITLNVFKQIEWILTRESSFIWARNTKAMYAYLLGTVIYFTLGLFVFDLAARIIGLIMPIALTIIGFNLSSMTITKEMGRKRLLIMANIALLVFWSMTTIYMTIDLEYKKDYIEEAKKNLTKIDTEFLQHADSLRAVFDRSNGYNVKQLDTKTLESLVIGQLRLHQEFQEFRDFNEYTRYTHADYLWNYGQMITILQVGLLLVILLNGLYLIYLIRDSKVTTANKVYKT